MSIMPTWHLSGHNTPLFQEKTLEFLLNPCKICPFLISASRAKLCFRKRFEPKRPENVKLTLYWWTGCLFRAAIRYIDSCCYILIIWKDTASKVWKQQTRFDMSLFMRDNSRHEIPHVSLPGLSRTLFPKRVEAYTPKRRENVKKKKKAKGQWATMAHPSEQL